MGPSRLLLLGVGGTGVYAAAVYVGYLYAKGAGTGTGGPSRVDLAKVSAEARQKRWEDADAEEFERRLEREEFILGMGSIRRRLIRQAHGRVLETSVGTGRNFRYYQYDNCDKIVLTDVSENLLEKARVKMENIVKAKSTASKDADVEFESAVMPVEAMPFEDSSFDSVINTFGLCSVTDPVQALHEMSRVCKADGKILLLQHGQTSQCSWLARFLDAGAGAHAEKYGCVYNRDIPKIVRGSGLKIEKEYTHHFGTTHIIIASKDPRLQN